MVAITSSASVVRSGAQQSAVPQVRRAAEQAQRTADTLQAQARDAWQQVDRAEANARAVDSRANQATSSAAQARQDLVSFGAGLQSAQSASAAQSPGGNTNPVETQAPATIAFPAVINSQGQRIGTLINITA